MVGVNFEKGLQIGCIHKLAILNHLSMHVFNIGEEQLDHRKTLCFFCNMLIKKRERGLGEKRRFVIF